VFDFDDNTFELDVLELVAQRAVSKPRDGGFPDGTWRWGRRCLAFSSSLGLFRTDTTTEDVDLHQAFLSYVAPVGSGLRFDAGKFRHAVRLRGDRGLRRLERQRLTVDPVRLCHSVHPTRACGRAYTFSSPRGPRPPLS